MADRAPWSGVGIALLNPTLRSVVWLAKQLSTLATLAPDRLLLGVGLGGAYEPEFRAAGVDRTSRRRRLDEALALLPQLAAGEPVLHSGAFEVDCDGLAPGFPMWLDPEEIASARGRLDEVASEHGRPAPGVALVSEEVVAR